MKIKVILHEAKEELLQNLYEAVDGYLEAREMDITVDSDSKVLEITV